MKEQYQPSQKEVNKAEEMMTPKEKEQSEFREKVMSRGEYCGSGEDGHLKALELAAEGKGTPASINYNEWVILKEDDFEGLKEIIPHKFNRGRLERGRYTWDFSEPTYDIYHGSYMRSIDPRERNKKYRSNFRELKKNIADLHEMFDLAKNHGEIIESGSGMSMIESGKAYVVNKEDATYVVSEKGYERIYENIGELVAAIGAERADEPEDNGQPGTIYWREGWQGGIGGGVTKVEVNGKEYFRQI